MRLIEEAFCSPTRVDRDCMVIRGAKIIGRESRNGRVYSDQALDKLVGFYEGKAVNVDHDRSAPNPERKMADGFGVLKHVVKQADGIYGDLHYLREHPMAPVILERAERMPESFGLSHAAEGRVVRKNGKLIVEDVEAVHSVDIVREPATTKGLFESEGEYDMAVMTIREIVEQSAKDTNGLEMLLEQMDAGVIAADTPVDVAPDTSGADMVKAAFRAAVMQAFDDESLDTVATIARIKEILKAQDKLNPPKKEEKKEEESPPKEEEAKVEESISKIKAELNVERAKNLLLESSREATPERIKAVASTPEGERQILVESWPVAGNTERPPISKPRYTADKFDFPRDPKKFAATLR